MIATNHLNQMVAELQSGDGGGLSLSVEQTSLLGSVCFGCNA